MTSTIYSYYSYCYCQTCTYILHSAEISSLYVENHACCNSVKSSCC